MSMELALVLLVSVLSLSCLAVVLAAGWILVRYSKQLSLVTELAIRFPYRSDPQEYGAMAVFDSIAAGRGSRDEVVLPTLGKGGDTIQQPEPAVPASDGM